MKRTITSQFLFLLFIIVFSANASDATSSASNSQGQLVSDFQKEKELLIKSALRRSIFLDQEEFDYFYENASQEIKNYIELIKKARASNIDPKTYYEIIPHRLLLVGPPGVGKSTLAGVISHALGWEHYFIKMPLLGNEYKNSETTNLIRVFNNALALKRPCIIILDELNIFVEHKNKAYDNDDSNAGSVLWLLLDQCAQNPDIFIIGTANDVASLPAPLKDRFEGNIIKVYSNSADNRSTILEHHLSKGVYICSDAYMGKLAGKTERFSPRQLQMLVTLAQQEQFLKTGSIDFVTEQQLEAAYRRILASSEILHSKEGFSFKQWSKDNMHAIQAIGTSVNLGLVLASFIYLVVTGKKSLKSMKPAMP